MNTHLVGTLLLSASVALVACDSAPSSGGAGTSTPTGGATAKSTGGTTTAKATGDAPGPVEMVDHDLAAGDPSWAGWTAKGPKDAKVLADGVKGARIAAKGPSILDQKPGGDQGFDIAFAWEKPDLKQRKASAEKGAAASEGKLKVEFTKDEPELLQWKSIMGDSTTYNFVMAMKVEGKDITCQNNTMIGAGNEAEMNRMMDGCKSLAKKK
jgi:hypothetical protein